MFVLDLEAGGALNLEPHSEVLAPYFLDSYDDSRGLVSCSVRGHCGNVLGEYLAAFNLGASAEPDFVMVFVRSTFL